MRHKSVMTVPTLYYFDVEGRGEPTRLCFEMGGIKFKDVRFTRDEWVAKYKAMSPSGQAPMLEVDGKMMVESRAMANYAAKLAGLLPEKPEDYLVGEEVMSLIDSAFVPLGGLFRKEDVEANTKAAEVAIAGIDRVVGLRKGTKKYLTGDRITLGDIYVFCFFRMLQKRILKLEAVVPHIEALAGAMYEHPVIYKRYSKPTLYYFDTEGRGEAARLCFTLGGIEFNDVRFTREQWVETYKAMSPSGQCPFLEVCGQFIVESRAIASYAAKRAGLYPDNAEDILKVEEMLSLLDGSWGPVVKLVRQIGDAEENKKELKEKLSAVDRIIGERMSENDFLCGTKPTVADVWMFCIKRSFLERQLVAAEDMPHIVKVANNLAKMPLVQQRYEKST